MNISIRNVSVFFIGIVVVLYNCSQFSTNPEKESKSLSEWRRLNDDQELTSNHLWDITWGETGFVAWPVGGNGCVEVSDKESIAALDRSVVSAIIPGAKNAEQTQQNMAAGELESLPEKLREN